MWRGLPQGLEKVRVVGGTFMTGLVYTETYID
jgi:hypothetical protein